MDSFDEELQPKEPLEEGFDTEGFDTEDLGTEEFETTSRMDTEDLAADFGLPVEGGLIPGAEEEGDGRAWYVGGARTPTSSPSSGTTAPSGSTRTQWGEFVSRNRLTPKELLGWMTGQERIKEWAKDRSKDEVREVFANLLKQKPDPVLITGSEVDPSGPRLGWKGERLGWLDRRPDMKPIPLHQTIGQFWVREGGLRQRLEAMGAPGRDKWQALENLMNEVGLGMRNLEGVVDPLMRRASSAFSHAIMSGLIGHAYPAAPWI